MVSQTDAAISVKVSQFLADKNTNPEGRLALIAFLEALPAYSETDAALLVKCSQFLADKNTKPEDRLALKAFLEACPAYSKPTSYISDIEQRLQLLREIRQEYEKYNFELDSTAALWSALMVAPLERLRYLRDLNTEGLFGALKDVAINIPLLLKVFLAKNPSQEELIRACVSKKRTRSSVHSQASSAVDKLDLDKNDRDKSESQKCEQRDRCCIVTSTANPDICHVFPFAAKNNPDQTSRSLSVYMYLWGTQVFQRLKGLLVGDRNIIDTAANMVALQPLLHRWWGKAIIGFEPIEKIEKGIRLRVRWLPKTRLAMKDSVALDLNPLECLQPYSDQGGNIGIAHSKTFRPIVDGTVIDITAQDESAVPSWDLFSLQWDLIRMASLCGAAEAGDDDDWESDDDDDDEAPLAKVARTTDDLYLDSPVTASAAPGYQTPRFQPLQSLLVQSRESSPTKSLQPWKSSPASATPGFQTPRFQPLQSRESSPTKSSQPRESLLAKSRGGRVDENNPWGST